MIGDRYRVEDQPIGHGGMGVVYKAFDTIAKRFVALKTLKGEVDRSSLELFQREWTVLAQLSHPNIVDVLDIGDFTEHGQQKPYFVMPLLPGCTLNHLIGKVDSRLTVERVVEIVCQACRGLQAAHDRGLVHRDLKPSNLFVMSDDTVKIIDFGVVHLGEAESKPSLRGTLHYMAPEQLELKPATAKSDLYSLGVVCYEALTGRKPFERTTDEEVIQAIRSHMPAPVSDLNSAINEQISRAVHKAMAKQPYHRFASVREFSELLQRALRNDEQIEIFDRARIQPRINRTKRALNEGDNQLALDILDELQSEGNIDAEMPVLRMRAEQAIRSKAIYQLIESARTRMEEEEYPLALQNVQRVLDIEPGNIDALALKSDVERQRSATQIGKWLEIARQHCDNRIFAKARQAVGEVLRIDPSDRAAKELLEEISRGEQELTRLRQEKQMLYDSALKSYRNGEFSSALKNLEKVINLGKRAPGHPNTDAQYLAFYEEVRGERDELQRLYTEGKKAVVSRDFVKALDICSEVLRSRPREPLFKALKIEAEDILRQEKSAAIARLHTDIAAEADLDRKFGLLKEAIKQFPDEQIFSQSIRLVKERRDLVKSIVSRARHYESQGNPVEASNQWDILRSVYSQHPGLDFEIQRVSRKQELHAQEEAKARWVDSIDQALIAGDDERAEELVCAALAETPGDGELVRLRQQVLENARRNSETLALLDESQQLLDSGDRLGAIQQLRMERRRNAKNPTIVTTLRSALVEHARNIAEQDWRAALPFIDEALEIEPADPGAASVSRLIEDVRQREQIERYLVDARELQTQHKLTSALAKIKQGLDEYPKEIRMAQLRNNLQFALASSVAEADRNLEPPAAVPESARAATAGAGGPTGQSTDTRRLFNATQLVSAYNSAYGAPHIEPAFGKRHVLTRKLISAFATAAILCAALIVFAGKRKQSSDVLVVEPARLVPAAGKGNELTQAPSKASGGEARDMQQSPNSARRSFPRFLIDFKSSPSAARVVVDNLANLTCLTPCPLELSRGQHTVLVSAPSYVSRQVMIRVPDDRDVSTSLHEQPKQIRLISDPTGAALSVDGEARGVTPLTLSLSQGQHKLVLSKGDITAEKTVEVTPDSDSFIVLKVGAARTDKPLTSDKFD